MIRLPAWSVPGEGSLPGLRTATFSLCPHVAERGRERLEWSRCKDSRWPTHSPSESLCVWSLLIALVCSCVFAPLLDQEPFRGQAGAVFLLCPLVPAQSGHQCV